MQCKRNWRDLSRVFLHFVEKNWWYFHYFLEKMLLKNPHFLSIIKEDSVPPNEAFALQYNFDFSLPFWIFWKKNWSIFFMTKKWLAIRPNNFSSIIGNYICMYVGSFCQMILEINGSDGSGTRVLKVFFHFFGWFYVSDTLLN